MVEYLAENHNPLLHYFPMYPEALGDTMRSILEKTPNKFLDTLSIDKATGTTSYTIQHSFNLKR